MTYQHKSFPFSVKAVDDEQGIIEAYGSVFDNTDEGGDVVRPGAFTRTINFSKQRVKAKKATYLAVMLWQHDPHMPIGGWTDLKEDAHGLLCKGQIVLSTQQGKEAYELIKAGIINEFSIGYDIPTGGANWDSKESIRNLTELRLWEVSPVTFAMNSEALLVGVKAKKDKPMKKDFTTLFATAQAADSLEDWGDLINTLTQAMMQVFGMGDSPDPDMATALEQFGDAVKGWQAKAIECDLSSYLSDQGYCSNNGSDTPPYIPSSIRAGSSYMSRDIAALAGKAGRSISADNMQNIQDHVDNMKALATAHMKAVRTAADDFASIMQGAEPTYVAPHAGTPDEQEGGKQSIRRAPSALPQTRSAPPQATRPLSKQDDTEQGEDEEGLTAALSNIRALRTVS